MAAQVEVQAGEVGRTGVGGRLLLSPLTDSSNKSLIDVPSIIPSEPNKPVPGPKPRLSPKPFSVDRNPTIKPILAPKPQPRPKPESTHLSGLKLELPNSPKPQQPAAPGKPSPVSANSNRPASTIFKTAIKLSTGQTTKPVVHPFKPAPPLIAEDPSKPIPPVPALRQRPSGSSSASIKSSKRLSAAEWSGSTKNDNKDQTTSSRGGPSIARAKSMGSLDLLGQEEEEKKSEPAVQRRPQPRASRPRPVSAIFLDSSVKTEASVPAPRWPARRPLSADLTSKFESIGLSLHHKSTKENTKENTPEEKPQPQRKETEKIPKSATPLSTNVEATATISDQSNKKTEEPPAKDPRDNKGAVSVKKRISLLFDSSSSPAFTASGQVSEVHTPVQLVPETEPAVGVKQLIKQLTVDTTPAQSPVLRLPLKPRPLPLDLTKRFTSEKSSDSGSFEAPDRHDISRDPQTRTGEAVSPSDQKAFVDFKDSQEQLKKASMEEGMEADDVFVTTMKDNSVVGDIQKVRASLFENVVEWRSVMMIDEAKSVNKVKDSTRSPFLRRESSDEGTLVIATYKGPESPSSPLRVVHSFDTLQAVDGSSAVSESLPAALREDKAMTLRMRRSEGGKMLEDRNTEPGGSAVMPEQQPRYLRIGALSKLSVTGLEQDASKGQQPEGQVAFNADRERQREVEQEEVTAAPKRLKMLPADEQPKPKATYFALTGQIQEQASPSMDTNSPFDDLSVRSALGSSQVKVLPMRKNPSLDEAYGKKSSDHAEEVIMKSRISHEVSRSGLEEMMEGERKRELKKEAERHKAKMKELEREKKQLALEKDTQLEFERMKEREKQREFERQRQKAYEKEMQELEEKQRQRQLEKEKRRELERQRKLEEKERQREQERKRQKEEERQRELDRERQLREMQKMEELERIKEQERQRELDRERQLREMQKEKQKLEELERIKEQERQRELDRERHLREMQKEKQKLEELERIKEQERQRELDRERHLREMQKEKQKLEELERIKEQERQRELDRERQLREMQKEKQKLEEQERIKEQERQQLLEFQKQKQKERERLQIIEMEKHRVREKMEREQAEKIKQMALEQEMLRMREIEKEKERQREMEREMEREKQRELERQRQRELDRERQLREMQKMEELERIKEQERQRELDRERQLQQMQKEKQKMEELERIKEQERQRELDRERQLREMQKEKQKLEEQERIKEQERQQLLEFQKQKQKERERLQIIEMEKHRVREKMEREQAEKIKQMALEQEMLRMREIEKEKERQREMEKEMEREKQRELERQRQKELDRERQRQLDMERQELEKQRQRELEKERQRKEEIERAKEFEKQAERERQQVLELEKRRLREKEAEKMRMIVKQQEAERQRLKEKQKKDEQERAAALRPKVLDLDSVLHPDPFTKASAPLARWKEPAPRAEESYKPSILDIDSFTSQAQASPSKDLFPVSDIQGVDAGFGARLQPSSERDVSWKVPTQSSGGFTAPAWTTSPQDPWEIMPVEMSVDKPMDESRKSSTKTSPEQLLLRLQDEQVQSPQKTWSAVTNEAFLLGPFAGAETETRNSAGGVSSSSSAEQLWLSREPQPPESKAEARSHRRSHGAQELNRMRSRSVSRRSAPSSSAVEASLSRMRSRSAHREHDSYSWEQQKQTHSGEEELKDSDTPVHDSDSQYGTWETGLRTDDSLTPATPSSESNLSPSPRKPTPSDTPGDPSSLFGADTVDSLPPSSAEKELPPFPDAPVALLDTSVLRSRAQLGKKRAPRSRPSRAALQNTTQAEDWLFRDSTEPKSEVKEEDSDSEEPTKGADTPSAVASQPQRVALFPGMDPLALKAQLRKRGESDNQSEGPAPSPPQVSRSPKSPFLPRAARVLPPTGGKENGEEKSPQWLKELKSKKRLSQYENES